MAQKSKFKIVTSLYNKNTSTATYIPQKRLAPNPPSDVRYNGVQGGFHENREKQFSIQFDGQQIYVEERRPSSLIAQGNVQSNSSHTAPQRGSIHCDRLTAIPDVQSNSSHMAPQRGSIHCDRLTAIPDVQSNSSHTAPQRGSIHCDRLTAIPDVQSNSSHTAPQRGSIHCDRLTAIPDFVSKKRRTIQHPRTLGTIVNRVDVEPTLQDPSTTTNCTHQSPDEQEGNFENIHVEYDFVDEEGMPSNMVDVTKFCEYSISNKREKLGDSYSTVGAYVKAHQTKSGEYPNEYTRAICVCICELTFVNTNIAHYISNFAVQEKAIATCEERNFTSSSDPSVLTLVLDAVYNGHHGGYERGRGLGWSRVAWSHNMANEARNDNIRRLTVELENTQSELQNAMAEIQGVRAREREMEARQQEQVEAMQAREREMQMRLEHLEAILSMNLPNASVILLDASCNVGEIEDRVCAYMILVLLSAGVVIL
ncbi:hypothetical protein Taro_000515 [Colocasia esculenta]|uniref:Uncharacterized protein n=1 Tax=Colocasia esculenta TaxID=4460 RepID=A0A843TF37_COLES|nr:hypothetical protein [Colocasia esculenta]